MPRYKLIVLIIIGMIAATMLAAVILFITFANLIATPHRDRVNANAITLDCSTL